MSSRVPQKKTLPPTDKQASRVTGIEYSSAALSGTQSSMTFLSNVQQSKNPPAVSTRIESTKAEAAVQSASKLLEEQPWYHGLLPRDDLEPLLVKDGDFLVRRTENQLKGRTRDQYVLSLKHDNKPEHFIFQPTESNKWYIPPGNLQFATIVDLVDHYRTEKIPVTRKKATILKRPIERKAWEICHEQITKIENIGSGEFGEVFKATFKSGSGTQTVAVKSLHPSSNITRADLKSFAKEARIMRELRHENIIEIIGVAAQRPPVLIIMEYAPGGSLLSHIRKNASSLSPADMTRYCHEASKGMAYLEKQNFVHRDVAARNCLLGKNGKLKISDFGLCQQTENRAKSIENTKLPVKWVAPEVIRSMKQGNIKADVWAFGILIWEVFSGGLEPYPGMPNVEVPRKVAKEHYRMEQPGAMPKKVSELMQQCWEDDPEKRPSFKDIESRLGEVVKHLKKAD